MAKEKAPKKTTETAKVKAPLTLAQKKVAKAQVNSRKEAAKTILRETRKTLRAAKAAEKSTKNKKQNRKKNFGGYAPQSARITPATGPVQSVASRTPFAPKYKAERKWLMIDAEGQTVGRLASEIAMILRGKHKANFTPNNDAGDFVVVINAEKVKFTADKDSTKKYHQHSGWIAGLKTQTPDVLRRTFPERILQRAVKGMVPRTPLGRAQMTKLKIYTGAKHPHVAQMPTLWNLRNNRNSK